MAYIFAGLALCSAGFFVASLLAGWSFRRQTVRESAAPRPFSILKPLKGADQRMYECFRSHCLQEYPAGFDLVFGVNNAEDEAVPFVERLQKEFPERDIRLLVCTQVLGENRKVSNLAQMIAAARHPHVIVNDSDICVEPAYLAEIDKSFNPVNGKAVGLVTCLYRGVAGKSLWAQLESLGISTDFMPGVLTARMLDGGMHFGMGSTLAFTRQAEQAIGGLATLADWLADDYELGNRMWQKGYAVALSRTVVETAMPEYIFKDFWRHQLRWARTVKSSRPSGFLGMALTFGTLWSLLAVGFSAAGAWSLWLALAVMGLRLAQAIVIGGLVVNDKAVLRRLHLVPMRDLLFAGVWLASFFGNSITWRGERFALVEGKLVRESRQ